MTSPRPPVDTFDPARPSGSTASGALLVVTAETPPAGWPAAELASVPMTRPFHVGEEVGEGAGAGAGRGSIWEGVPADGAAAVAALRALLRAGAGQVGIGCGSADPAGRARGGRTARPPAYAAARVALAAAHRTHQGVALRASRGRGRTGPPPKAVEDAETCLWLLADLWNRRSPEGWAVADHMDAGLTGRECALRLDISPSAVSQRATAARYVEGRRAADLTGRLLDQLLRNGGGGGSDAPYSRARPPSLTPR